MLEEAVAVIRELWQGELVSHRGGTTRSTGRASTRVPDEPPPIAIAAAGPKAAALAGRIGDALVATAPDADLVAAFNEAGGEGKPCYGQLTVCYAPTREEAVDDGFRALAERRASAATWRRSSALPRHFRQATELLSPAKMSPRRIVCGNDPDEHRAALEEFDDAGFDRVYVHQVGPKQEPFFEFYEREILIGAGLDSRRR